jgi:hypothetical protein
MYLEAAPIWYSNVRFAFTLLENMKSFAQSIGIRNLAIQHIKFNVDLRKYPPKNDLFDAVNELLSAACRCLPGLRTIILDFDKYYRAWPLVTDIFSEGWPRPGDPITKATKPLFETESHIECVTWLGLTRHKFDDVNYKFLYLRECNDVKREKGSQGVSHVHRLLDISSSPDMTWVRKFHE